MKTPEEQNRLLLAMVINLATIVEEILAMLPPEYLEIENVKHATALAIEIRSALLKMEREQRSKMQ